MSLLSELNPITFNEIKSKKIYDLIGIQAQKFPDKIAVKHNLESITYKELELSSNQIAFYFKNANFIKGQVVAVAMDRSIQMTVCLLGLMKAGITYLPIDPNLPLERVKFLVEDSSASTLITSAKYNELYESFSSKLLFDEIWRDRNSYTNQIIDLKLSGDDLTYIIYTSGSTGLPKGVAISHYSLMNLLLSRQLGPGVDENDNMLGITTISFDIAEEELYLPLINGAQLTIVDQEMTKDARALLEIIRKEKITIMQATPYIWQMMLEAGWDYRLPIKAFCGGESLTKDLAEKLLDRCSELWNMYGPTETTICSITKKITSAEELITIGTPIANTWIYILDEDLNEVAPGEEGEICISGAGVAQGYINRPELTAEKFIADKFSDIEGQKMYRTGDLGKFHENGDIQFLGRRDHQVKIRGYRIETEEIEHQLNQLENIKDSLIIVHNDTVGISRLVAYVVQKVSSAGENASNEIYLWKQELRKLLPEYMVPSDYVIIDKIPLSPNGKVDRKQLPEPVFGNSSHKYVAPVTELEKAITDIWIKNLNIKDIGIEDNFFDLGGTSLIAIKIQVQLEKITKKRLAPSILFKYPTIEKLVLVINDSSLERYKSLTPIKAEGFKIPLYIVPGSNLNVFFIRNMALNLDQNQPVYGLQALDLDGEDKSLNTIEKLAEFYINEIISHNPSGPYAIAGYSIGGVIAFEMVKQLKKLGKEVKLLALFDTNLQVPIHQYPFFKRIYSKTLRQFSRLKFRLVALFKEPKENIIYIGESSKKKIENLLLSTGFFNKDQLPNYMLETIKQLKMAFKKYKIEPYDVHIDLFIAKKNMYYIDDPEFLGWKKYALNGISVHEVSSTHHDMFYSEKNNNLSAILQKRLDNIN